MLDTLTDAGETALLTNTPTTGHVLWYRPEGRRTGWEIVARGETQLECLDAMETSGRRHGSWIILQVGQEP